MNRNNGLSSFPPPGCLQPLHSWSVLESCQQPEILKIKGVWVGFFGGGLKNPKGSVTFWLTLCSEGVASANSLLNLWHRGCGIYAGTEHCFAEHHIVLFFIRPLLPGGRAGEVELRKKNTPTSCCLQQKLKSRLQWTGKQKVSDHPKSRAVCLHVLQENMGGRGQVEQ